MSIITMIETERIEAINRAHLACQECYGNALEHALDCGRMLAAVKADLTHGEWGTWVEDNTEVSDRTARVYMQLAAAPELEDRQTSADLSIAGALKKISKPKPEPKEDVIGELRALGGTADPVTIDYSIEEHRLDDPPQDISALRYGGTWSEQQRRKAIRVRDQLDNIAFKITDALETTSLSRVGVHGILEGAAVDARQAYNDLDALKFSFA